MRESAAEAMEEALRYCTVGIVGGSGKEKWLGIGAGTLIRWRGRELILTAQHVTEGTRPEDLRFFLPLKAVPGNADRATLLGLNGVPTSELHPFSELHIHSIVTDNHLDLPAIDVTSSLVGDDVMTF
jgi:hypothetical protein